MTSSINKPGNERASLDTVWDKTIFKGEQLTDVEARAVAELALTVAGARQAAQKYKQDSTGDIARAALFELICEKFDARFVDDFLTDDTDDASEVTADDALLDRLGSATPGQPTTELDAVLLTGRAAIEQHPIPDLVDTDTAIATIKAGA